MKLIRLRYVHYYKTNTFCLQRKTWYGSWRYISFTIEMGYGSVMYNYSDKSKKELLKGVLKSYFKVSKDFVIIKEYPTIKIY